MYGFASSACRKPWFGKNRFAKKPDPAKARNRESLIPVKPESFLPD
jgi:hypothetical protein